MGSALLRVDSDGLGGGAEHAPEAVMYRTGTDGQQETGRLAAKDQFTPRFVFTHGTQGFSALLAPDVLAAVRCEPSVSYTEYNAAVTVEERENVL